MLVQCCVCNAGPTLYQHWVNILPGCVSHSKNSKVAAICVFPLTHQDPNYITGTHSCKYETPSIGLLLGQRRRRWANSKPTLGQRIMFAGTVRPGSTVGGHHSITRGVGVFLNWCFWTGQNIYFTSCLQYFIYFTFYLKQNISFTLLELNFSVNKVGSQSGLSIDVGPKETTEAMLRKLKCHSMMLSEARQNCVWGPLILYLQHVL